jgi:hypothetical protein
MSITHAAASATFVLGLAPNSIVTASTDASETIPSFQICAVIDFKALSFLLLPQIMYLLFSFIPVLPSGS